MAPHNPLPVRAQYVQQPWGGSKVSRVAGSVLTFHPIFAFLTPRNCPVLTMEAMNGECQEAIIGAFMHMHPDEIQLTKEQVRCSLSRCGVHIATFNKRYSSSLCVFMPSPRPSVSRVEIDPSPMCILHHRHTVFVFFRRSNGS